MKKIVIAQVGGFGNHVRWLMLLDPQYSFRLDTEELKAGVFHNMIAEGEVIASTRADLGRVGTGVAAQL